MKPIKQMSDADVINAAREWAELQGDEAYNPYEIEKARRIAQAMERDWSREATIAKRKEWNDMVRAGKLATAQDVAEFERRKGWTALELKGMVKHHRL